MPQGGDSAIVLLGDTVTLAQNVVYNGQPLQVQIYGVWYFTGGGSKITLPCGSHVEIMIGGMLLPNSNSGGHSETVRICNETYWYFDEGPVDGYEIWPPFVLPIELTSFEARSTEAGVALDWTTASENGTVRFEVDVAQTPDAWELLCAMPAQGTSITETNYSFTDANRSPGLWYYALCEVDDQGERHVRATRALLVERKNGGIMCMPNPVREGHLLVFFDDRNAEVDVSVLGIASRTMEDPYTILDDEGMLSLDVSHLQRGYYVAAVTFDRKRVETCVFSVL